MATPEQVTEYEQKWQTAVDTVFSVVDADGWKKEHSKEKDLEIFIRHDKSSSFAQVKSVTTVHSTLDAVEQCFKTVKTVDDKTPKDQREGAIERRLLGQAGDGADGAGFFYIVVESSSRLVSPREFLCYQKIARKDGKIALVRTSIENEALHKVGKGNVRGNMIFQGFVAEPEGDNIKLTFVVQADPCGSVPAMVYNTVATGQGYNLLSMRKELNH
ncbi:hypothetical protein M9Y10_027103 [Tritrichomonas musculus]|uniref:START domain-containing protein n=1 Tax=Tritrichomonas musculus TaxID=1915356 RepID=A0ABR2H5H3_9EUKA